MYNIIQWITVVQSILLSGQIKLYKLHFIATNILN